MKWSFEGMGLRVAVLAGWLVATGCGESDHGYGTAEAVGGHRHGSIHGGVAVELGEHRYQLDVATDPVAGVVKVWIMDGHMENFIRVPLKSFELAVISGAATQTVTLTATANGGTGETVGDTSQFQGTSPWLVGLTNFTGAIPEIDVRGTMFRNVRFKYSRDP